VAQRVYSVAEEPIQFERYDVAYSRCRELGNLGAFWPFIQLNLGSYGPLPDDIDQFKAI
jgi:hypothetical protein